MKYYQQYLMYLLKKKYWDSDFGYRYIEGLNKSYAYERNGGKLFVLHSRLEFDVTKYHEITREVRKVDLSCVVVWVYYPGAVLQLGVLRVHVKLPGRFIDAIREVIPGLKIKKVKDALKYI